MHHLLVSLDALGRDTRVALRSLRRSPLFALAAVLTLAVGIGANTAIYSVVDGLLLRPLPYPQAERLSLVSVTYGSADGEERRWSHTGRTWEVLRDHADAVDLALFSNWVSGVNLSAAGEAAHVRQQRVGAGFFRVLGVEPAVGRGFNADEDVPGGPRVAVLSHELWQGKLGGDPEVLGSRVLLKGEPHAVVGVMPPGFRSTAPADLWTPVRPSTSGEGGGANYAILARPRPGVSAAAAEDEVAALGRRAWEEQRPVGDDARRFTVTYGLLGLQRGLTAGLDGPLLVLWALVGLLLLVVCANLAGLMLARWSGRSREIAARMALGSGRAGVVRQVLVESTLLAVAGAVLGVVLGRLGLGVLLELARDTVGLWQPVALDGRVVAVTALVALLAALLFGLGPALRASRLELRPALAAGGGGAASTGATGWQRRLLVVAEVAVGVLLVVFAGVLVRSFVELRGLDPGFDPRGVVVGSLSLDDARYADRDAVIDLFDRTLERLRSEPGIEAAAVGLGLPFQRPLNLPFRVAGQEEAERRAVTARYVTPGYFRALDIPLLRGRGLQPGDDAGAPGVAVVNRSFVEQRLGGSERPLGTGLVGMGGAEVRVVGVVGDVLVDPSGLGGAAPLDRQPMVYLPVAQMDGEALALVHTWFQPSWMVRSRRPAGAVADALRGALAGVDPGLPFAELRTMDTVAMEALGMQRFLMTLVVALAGVALLLAAVGIWALVANTVAERTRELGIRMALGAGRRRVLGAVVVPGVTLAAAGTGVGLALALAGARMVRSLVHGVSASDPWSLAAGTALLLTVATLASLLPGLRVLRLDPARTLREE